MGNGCYSLITDTLYIRAYDKSDGDDTVMVSIYNDSIAGADTTIGMLHCECLDTIIITDSMAATYSVVFPSCTLQAATAYWLVIKNYNRLAATRQG